MYKFLRSLFYRLYRWASYLNFDNTPEYTSLFTVSILLVINFQSSVFLLSFLIGRDLLPINLTHGNLLLGVVIASSYAINYFLFIHNGRLEEIKKEFSEESKMAISRSNLIVWGFLVFTAIYLGLALIAYGRM